MFIRTKTGIYKFTQGMKIENWCVNGLKTRQLIFDDNKTVINFLGEFVAQSENLDDLCDRAFAFHKDSPWVSPDLEDFSLDSLKAQILESTKNTIDEFIFKLAIWTEEGLIYVAKTNDEGVLCLI